MDPVAAVNWRFKRHAGGEGRPPFYDIDATYPSLRILDRAYPVIRAEMEAIVAEVKFDGVGFADVMVEELTKGIDGTVARQTSLPVSLSSATIVAPGRRLLRMPPTLQLLTPACKAS